MRGIALRNFRRIYFLGAIALIIIMALSISLPYYIQLKSEYERKIHQLSESIISQKKTHVRAVINEKFTDINHIRQSMEAGFTKEMELLLTLIAREADEKFDLTARPDWNGFLSSLDLAEFGLVLTDISTGEEFRNGKAAKEIETALSVSKTVKGNLALTISFGEEDFNNQFVEAIRENIYQSDLPDNEYVWVNHILDYSGGDGYAIRTIHPNLPLTEGTFLSTNTVDIMGNKPYRDELDGINRNGEAYLDYYFKELDNNNISHKISYARLYKPLDWVVCTGVYLNDVDQLIADEQKIMTHTLRRELFVNLIITLLGIGVAILVAVKFERILRSLILSYTDKLDDALQQIKNVAYRDPLTDLLNRRAMYDSLRQEVSRHGRTGENFSLIMADIDFFKRINDTYGHPGGDEVLKKVSQIFRENIRSTDSISRWGGEEFLLLLSSADIVQAVNRGEKIRQMISETEIVLNGEEVHLTMTMGVAAYRPGEPLNETLKRADLNMYKGKKNGRNQVVSES